MGDQLFVGGCSLTVTKDAAHLFCLTGTLALQGQRCYQTLDLRCLTDLLALLIGEGARDDVLTDIIVLGQVEQLTDVVGTLRSQPAGDRIIRQSLDCVLADLCDDQVQDGDVLPDDATTDRLTLTFTGPALTVSLVSLLTQKTDTGVGEDALTHGETLLVISTRDAEDVSCELFTEDVSVDLLSHATFVQVLETLFVIDFDDLLHARAGAGNVDLFWCRKGGDKEVSDWM